jgi:hypothetical protein
MDVASSIRAGLNTVAASNTVLLINKYKTSPSNVGCPHWAYLDTIGFGAMIAKFGDKKCFFNRPFTMGRFKAFGCTVRGIDEDLFIGSDDVSLYPRAVIFLRDMILQFTGLRTFAAPNARFGIHNKPIECFGSI